MTPLPAGFPQPSVIPNSATVRLTRPGLDFISANLGTVAGKALGSSGGLVTFNIPPTSTSISILITSVTVNVCQTASAGQCVADINVGGAQLHVDAVTPQRPAASRGTVPVEDRRHSGRRARASAPSTWASARRCNASPNMDYAAIPVSATLPIIDETTSPRNGYSIIDTSNAQVSATIDQSIVNIGGSGIGGTICAGVINTFVKGTLVSDLQSQIGASSRTSSSRSCAPRPTRRCPPPAPTGRKPATRAIASSRPAPGTCVPTLLGTRRAHGPRDARREVLARQHLGGRPRPRGVGQRRPLAGLSAQPDVDGRGRLRGGPESSLHGTHAQRAHARDARRHAAQPAIELRARGAERAAAGHPHPRRAHGRRAPIPRRAYRRGLRATPGRTSASRSRAASSPTRPTSAYNSGVLCLGVSTEEFQALSTGYVSAVIPSVKDLTFEPGKQAKPAAMAITTRPQKPPTVVDRQRDRHQEGPAPLHRAPAVRDRLLRLERRPLRPRLHLHRGHHGSDQSPDRDRSEDEPERRHLARHRRSGRGQRDGDQLVAAARGSRRSSAPALSSLLGGIVGQFLGNGFSPINISSALASYGIGITIPAGGFRKLTKGTDDFLALFADLATTPAGRSARSRRRRRSSSTEIHPEAMTLEGANRALFPKLHVALSSPNADGVGARRVHVLDRRSAASRCGRRRRDITVDDQYLFLQGKHVLYATARVVGHPETEDPTPAEVPFLIDVLAPIVSVDTQPAGQGRRRRPTTT